MDPTRFEFEDASCTDRLRERRREGDELQWTSSWRSLRAQREEEVWTERSDEDQETRRCDG